MTHLVYKSVLMDADPPAHTHPSNKMSWKHNELYAYPTPPGLENLEKHTS